MRLLQFQELVADLSIAREHVDPALGNFANDPAPIERPEQIGRKAGRARIIAPVAHADGDVALVANEVLEKRHQDLRWLLKIGGDDPEEVALRCTQTGADGGKGSKVARMKDQLRLEGRIRQCSLQQSVTVFGARIDHEHEFGRHPETLLDDRGDARELRNQCRNKLGSPIDRGDDRVHLTND